MFKNIIAAQIQARYTGFGRNYLSDTSQMVFLKPVSKSRAEAISYKLMMKFHLNWKNHITFGRKYSVNLGTASPSALQILKQTLQSERITHLYKEYSLFRNITEVFEYQSRRPDLAKKAQQRLVRMLSTEFFAMNSRRLHNEFEQQWQFYVRRQENRELETIRRLERYLARRNLITGQALDGQINLWKREILYTYLSILEKEQALYVIRPQGILQMQNMVREHVSPPTIRNLSQHRRELYRAARYITHDYRRITERSRLIEAYKRTAEKKAAAGILAEALSQAQEHIPREKGSPYQSIAYSGSSRIFKKQLPITQHSQTAGSASYEKELQFYKKERYQEDLNNTKRLVSTLEEQMKTQETLLTELRQKILSTTRIPETNIRKITGEVMRQMEQELHLERLRRGL